MRAGESSKVVVDAYAALDAAASVGPDLLAHLEGRAAALAKEAGHDHACCSTSGPTGRTSAPRAGCGRAGSRSAPRSPGWRIDLDPAQPVEQRRGPRA